ncbi:conserved membrane protein of unknown function [Modestobacter italicus]|uniref:Uncharacterized protein n=1 Tax=Modestobacter italicus (strain DSM 44449 / CECT 9708 / BC 501) TaxID=2732864 RepID=I4F4A0_MODI5|nr:hypothetical protein [Modestobacter marinus]CCH90463.1 conserved membrane protein of unknown function [Modestobacter marinus]
MDRTSASARTSTTREQDDHVRTLRPEMRALLAVFCVLTALATLALFVLSSATDEFFAWTIAPPLTAALMGAGYAAGFLLVALSLRDPVWAHSRLPVLTILAFTVITLIATLVHLDRFHLQPEFASLPFIARAAAWFWLVVYVLIPVAMLVSVVLQERAPGRDPRPGHPVPIALRAALGVESAALLVTGIALAAAPSSAPTLWPWPLTPLTARVVAAWLIAFGVATALAAFAGDLARLRTSAIAYTVFGVLTLVAVARYPDTIDWDGAPAWVFLAVTVAIVVTGAVGWRMAPGVSDWSAAGHPDGPAGPARPTRRQRPARG